MNGSGVPTVRTVTESRQAILLRRIAELETELDRRQAVIDRQADVIEQLRTQFAIGRHNVEEAERVFAGLDGDPPLAATG